MTGVNADPDEDHCPKRDQKLPAPAEFSDAVGESLAKCKFLFELFNDVTRKNLMLFQAFDALRVQRAESSPISSSKTSLTYPSEIRLDLRSR